jgi:hypothetical protein
VSVRKKTVVAVALIGGAAVLYDCGDAIIWDGSFRLTVRLQPAEPGKVRRVWVGTSFNREWAEENLLDPEWADRTLSEVADFREPFVVDVTCSWSTSGFGRERWYAQYRVLVLRVEYADGRRLLMLEDIPDSRQTREVAIPLP